MSSVIATRIDEVPVTKVRPPPEDLGKYVPEPGLPRANKAVSREKPDGAPGANPRHSVIQQHVEWFDRDQDGVIWPSDTFVGFRRLGFNLLICTLAALFIHLGFSYPTLNSWIPDPRLPIYIENLHRTKHGSDSETYDTEGRFVPSKFEEIFSKYDEGNKGGLSLKDIGNMVKGNMNVMDPFGWTAERMEWYVFYLLAANEDGLLTRERCRAMYDGTLWQKMAADREARLSQGSDYTESRAAHVKKVE